MNDEKFNVLTDMVVHVAEALGPKILASTAFVGGVTTGFLLTDEMAKQSVRATDDVDLIISTVGYAQEAQFEEELRARGFTERQDNDVIGRKWLGELQVDFMPSDNALGFTNRWYKDALKHAVKYEIKSDLTIRLLTPAHFLATKLEAYSGRGKGDILGSRDIEDIMSLIDGRASIIEDIGSANPEMLKYIANELSNLKAHPDFDYVVQSTSKGNPDRADYLHDIIDNVIRRYSGD